MSESQIQATSFSIAEISFIDSIGNAYDIKFIAKEVNIHTELFNNCMSGDILIEDAQNFLQSSKVHGNEYIYIKFDTPNLYPYEKFFRVYKVSDKILKNMSSFTYRIHFCSEEFILNQQTRISKSYKGSYTNDIVYDILSTYLGVPATKINLANFTAPATIRDLIIPNMKPFEAINWLASMSIDSEMASAYVFYEDNYGFNFTTLRNLYEQEPYKTIKINAKNIVSSQGSNFTGVDRFEIKQPFNLLESISNGAYASSMLKLDLLRQKVESATFDPVSNNVKLLNEFLPVNDAPNRFEAGLLSSSAYTRYYPSTNDDMVDKWLLQRASEFALLNSNRVALILPGDSQLVPGMVIDFDFPDYGPVNSSSEITKDSMHSGKYLVTSVRHKIADNKYYNYIEICKNSLIEGIPSAVSSEAYDMAKKS